ncbi:unnamed protein product [Prorocentrum cordatum]|uniref:SAP domain-containing protein n=1 Tax=Prorocentrum cordatum TaxID=2364126 RepID=A0ABN9T2Y7_9DINO|nr:unnamed protein product [Polarella glacialis]
MWRQRGYDAAAPSGPGYSSLVGEEGLAAVRMVPPMLAPPLTAFPKDARLPEAPRAGGLGDAGARGPRFGLLPPPLDGVVNARLGAAQPALVSKLDAMVDIRIVPDPPSEAERERIAAVEADLQSCICRVPEPYIRAQRPDHRVRPPLRYEPMWRGLERSGIWFQEAPAPPKDIHLEHETNTELKTRCMNLNLPVSGNRAQLEDRLKFNIYECKKMTVKQLKQVCMTMGCRSGAKQFMIEQLEELHDTQFDNLTLDELRVECTFRGLDADGTHPQLRARVQAYLSKA